MSTVPAPRACHVRSPAPRLGRYSRHEPSRAGPIDRPIGSAHIRHIRHVRIGSDRSGAERPAACPVAAPSVRRGACAGGITEAEGAPPTAEAIAQRTAEAAAEAGRSAGGLMGSLDALEAAEAAAEADEAALRSGARAGQRRGGVGMAAARAGAMAMAGAGGELQARAEPWRAEGAASRAAGRPGQPAQRQAAAGKLPGFMLASGRSASAAPVPTQVSRPAGGGSGGAGGGSRAGGGGGGALPGARATLQRAAGGLAQPGWQGGGFTAASRLPELQESDDFADGRGPAAQQHGAKRQRL